MEIAFLLHNSFQLEILEVLALAWVLFMHQRLRIGSLVPGPMVATLGGDELSSHLILVLFCKIIFSHF